MEAHVFIVNSSMNPPPFLRMRARSVPPLISIASAVCTAEIPSRTAAAFTSGPNRSVSAPAFCGASTASMSAHFTLPSGHFAIGVACIGTAAPSDSNVI